MAKAKSTEEKNKLQETLDNLNKKYGDGTILTLDVKNHKYEVISSGSIALDYMTLGIGGWARGKLYELIGWEGTGKSTICSHAVSECQKKGWKAFYIDGENACDMEYMTKGLGIKPEELLIVQISNGEEAFNIAEELIKTKEFALGIIDSDNSLLPKSVIEDGEVGDSAIGKKARLNGQAYPRLKRLIAEHNTCIIVTSQYREKIGVMFGDNRTTQGGHALKFYSDGRLEISKSLAKDGEEVYGNKTKIKAIKNKMSPPFKQCQFEIVYGQGIDKITEVLELINDLELGKKWGKTLTIGENKYDVEEFKTLLRDNEDFYNEMKTLIVNKLKNQKQEIIENDGSENQEVA